LPLPVFAGSVLPEEESSEVSETGGFPVVWVGLSLVSELPSDVFEIEGEVSTGSVEEEESRGAGVGEPVEDSSLEGLEPSPESVKSSLRAPPRERRRRCQS